MTTSFIERKDASEKFKLLMNNYEKYKNDVSYSKGIYVYGESGSGKSTFVQQILKELNYDVIYYDAGDIRNKAIIDTITKNNMSNLNIISMFKRKYQKIAIVMDEIDGMNSGDRGGINAIIKIVRPKKTKKQKFEDSTCNPIICIGNKHADKKIMELIDNCNSLHLDSPTQDEIFKTIDNVMHNISLNTKNQIVSYINKDLRKLNNFINIYNHNKNNINDDLFSKILQIKGCNDDTKQLTRNLIHNRYSFKDHATTLNETDRTIVGLLWHENIIDPLQKLPKNVSIPLYNIILHNISIADYIDRITFQKQIWQFNEMSSIIKTFNNNYIFHNNYHKKISITDIRFTKVLTKYSTEYNNNIFIQNLSQMFDLDKKDIYNLFWHLLSLGDNNYKEQLIIENYEFSKLDLHRIYKYLNKYSEDNIIKIDL